MHISLKTTNYSITDDIQAYLDERLASLEKITTDNALCEVELSKVPSHAHGAVWCAEINVTMDGRVYRAVNTEESMNAAIDKVKDEIATQVKKDKSKNTSLLRRSGAKMKEWLRFGGDH